MVARGVVQVETARRPAFDLLFFLLGLLVPELPAVPDLRQESTNFRNIRAAPKADSNAADPNKGRKSNLLPRDVAVQ
jgi:hypothetical protein